VCVSVFVIDALVSLSFVVVCDASVVALAAAVLEHDVAVVPIFVCKLLLLLLLL